MKDFIITLQKNCRLIVPKQFKEIMEIKDGDYLVLRLDPSMKSFTVHKARIEVV